MVEGKKPESNSRFPIITLSLMVLISTIIAILADVGASVFGMRIMRIGNEDYYEALEFEQKGEYEHAIVSYQSAIASTPEDARAYNGLAWLYTEEIESNLDEAISLAQIAVNLARNQQKTEFILANYLDTLGWAYYKNGDYEQAAATLQEAVELDDYERTSFISHLEAANLALANVSEE